MLFSIYNHLCTISRIGDMALSGLSSLTTLSLADNRIVALPPNLLDQATNLR